MGKVFKALKKAGLADTSSAEEGFTSHQQISERDTLEEFSGQQQEDRRLDAFSLERSDWDERLTRATAVRGTVAESFRALRTKILYPEEGRRIRSVLVTSAGPGEGKSFVTANLGVAFAQGMDHKALMINCDLRRPSLESLFGVPNERGLADYLGSGDDYNKLIVNVGVEKLSILPSGRPPVNPAELLGASGMKRLIEDLAHKDEKKIMILDSPPLHSAAETAVLVKYVDAVVLVVRYKNTRREHVQSLVDQIGKEKIIGVVFNAYESSPLEEKLFGAYESQYGYYYEEE
ncbi:MAG: hypothetical protein DSY58_02640 [Desulfobulbus sp.]|nr:MAG: hypothetical protein DSY58_02640 [Desulfobulbus sp.]